VGPSELTEFFGTQTCPWVAIGTRVYYSKYDSPRNRGTDESNRLEMESASRDAPVTGVV
jgi:hypothetical protein